MSIDLDDLGERIAVHAAHFDAAMHTLLTDLRVFDESKHWYRQGAKSCAHWLSWRVGWTYNTSREHVRVAHALGKLPLIDDALRRGEVSYCKVRAITRVATAANEALLLEDATYATGAELERICRKYAMVLRGSKDRNPNDDRDRRYVRKIDREDGMVKIEAVLHPDEAAIVWAALDAIARERCRANTTTTPEATVETTEACATDPGLDCATIGCPGDVDYSSHSDESLAFDDEGDATSVAEHIGSRDARHTSATGSLVLAPMPSIDRKTDVKTGSANDPAGDDDNDDNNDNDNDHDDEIDYVPLDERKPSEATYLDTDDEEPGSTTLDLSKIPIRTPSYAMPNTAGRQHATARDDPTALRHTTDPEFDRADALVQVMLATLRGNTPQRSPIELVVTVSADALAHPHAADDPIACIGDLCVSAEAARRLACDCGVVTLVEDEHGNPLSVGRKTRSLPSHLKRALAKRDRTCRFPGCSNRMFLEAHHIEHWANGGETSMNNLLGVCTFHHLFVHEYGYRIELDESGDSRFYDPKGRLVLDVPQRPQIVAPAMSTLVGRYRELDLTASTNAPKWSGDPVRYDLVIEDLALIDQL